MNETACPKASRIMAAFDALPEPLRRFVADYPRGVPALVVANVLEMEGGNVARAIEAIKELAPTHAPR
jgi:hypothetical protein